MKFSTPLTSLTFAILALCTIETSIAETIPQTNQNPPEHVISDESYFDTPTNELKLFVEESNAQEFADAGTVHQEAQERENDISKQFVKIDDNSITVILSDGNGMTIPKAEIGESEVEYLGYFSNREAGYYIFSYYNNEMGSGECFVSATNGKLFYQGVQTIISPNRDWMITYYASPEGEDSATIEYYSLYTGNIEFLYGLWSRTLLPYDIRIGDYNTLYIKAYKNPWDDQEFVYYKLPFMDL